jgi:hypothetical protein
MFPLGECQTPGGVDTLHVAIYGEWEGSAWESLVSLLSESQADAQEAGEPVTLEGPDGQRLLLKEHGHKHGIFCPWSLQWDGITLDIANHPECSEHSLNVWVEIGSIALMELGHREAWGQVVGLLTTLGLRIKRAVPSRVDVCVDLPGVDVGELVSRAVDKRRIARARKWAYYENGLRWSGFQCGTDVQCRAYDKALELRERTDPRKLEVIQEKRWGGKIPETATRVEFQLRRDPLREQFDVQSVEDLFAKLPAICVWLTQEWLRLTDDKPDRDNGNEDRTPAGAVWQKVGEAFKAWTGAVVAEVAKRVKRCPVPGRLMDQARGCLESVMAVMGIMPLDADEFVSAAGQVMRAAFQQTCSGAPKRVKKKRERFEAGGPGVSAMPVAAGVGF